MAIQSRVVDDLDLESDADEVVRLGIDGKWIVFDLSGPHARQLRAEVAAWWPYGRPENKPRPEVKRQPSSAPKADVDWWSNPTDAGPTTRKRYSLLRARIREWGYEDGRWNTIGQNGRIPRALADAFREAHPEDYAELPELTDGDEAPVLAVAK